MKTRLWILILFTCLFGVTTARETQKVSDQKMQQIYEKIRTPYKYGLVVAPADNNHKIDCPTVFRKNNQWYMTYLIYNGKDGSSGRGYETWIASSNDLLNWKTQGPVLSFRDSTFWDSNQRGGYPALPDMNWGGSYEMQSWKGKNWLTYIGGASAGYEAGPLKVGLAYTPEDDLTKAKEWKAFKKPILAPEDKDAQYFENITQYKSTVYWDKDEKLGSPFVMFYNAGGIHPETKVKAERIGIALSKDMKKWKRYSGNPIFTHEEGITGDAHIQKIDDVYVMFYFSAFRKDRNYKAFNTFAASYDLIHWTDWKGKDLIIPSKDYDELFAHKSYVINWNGVVYHYYCAVNNFDQRGIAVAVSKPLGRSDVKFPKPEIKSRRSRLELDMNWKTKLINKGDFQNVNIPHNWDDYYGYRQLIHGNLHDTAIYIKKFELFPQEGKTTYLHFEGIGTYADIKLNGKNLGYHIVGRTTLSLNITDYLSTDGQNILEVQAEHPPMSKDIPWVCGGCSAEWGFSEGSQPLGIFRPVWIEVSDAVRIEPFGVHIWNNKSADSIYIETEIKNYSPIEQSFELVNRFNNEEGIQQLRFTKQITLKAGESITVKQSSRIESPDLWTIEKPYLYRLASIIKKNGKTTDELTTPFGIRTISWPLHNSGHDPRFFLNGKPTFVNGTCEYEHLLGKSHAFSNEQIKARIKQVKSLGFNALREAHQPHNLLYQQLTDKEGLLFWSQFSAHIWYDTPVFRENFKTLLRKWIKERRNSPSIVLWGLQNESVLPADFAQECTQIIREMDPTSLDQRLVTTCNGGEGTDWNVVQNWSGTYGGDIFNYGNELTQKDQLLNGEYGAWRVFGFHETFEKYDLKLANSENKMCKNLEEKIYLAEQKKDSVSGQFQWLYNSHDNPGRKQPNEAFRLIDRVGPVNYKGLTTPWEEPTDAYYLYKANYQLPSVEPFTYIISHNWADRFDKAQSGNIEVYSNCDSVLLYNSVGNQEFLGSRKNPGKGKHFIWENALIQYNVIRSVAYFEGKEVAEDLIVLNNLPKPYDFHLLYQEENTFKADTNLKYIYRINCGGDNYTDEFDNRWSQDNSMISSSWGKEFGMPYQASQRITYDPIQGTKDWNLAGSFRFGREKLNYQFILPNGNYEVEMYFIEPWYGTGGSAGTDAEGFRVFDVSINDSTVIDDLDIWAEKGHDNLLKKTVSVKVTKGILEINFPEVKVGQAVISAIAIGTRDFSISPMGLKSSIDWSWEKSDKQRFVEMPEELLPSEQPNRNIQRISVTETKTTGKIKNTNVRDLEGKLLSPSATISWVFTTGLAQEYSLRFRYINSQTKDAKVKLQLTDAKGNVITLNELTFPPTPDKWKIINTTTGSYINAGTYTLKLTTESEISFESLEIQ